MSRRALSKIMAGGLVTLCLFGNGLAFGQEHAKPASGFAAVPGEKGGQDFTGAYEVVKDWPKPMSSLPGHEKWRWGPVQGVFRREP